MNIQILKKTSKKGFSLLAGINRPVNPSQVTKLAESVKKLGILRPVVVSDISFLTGKSQRYIIDGQHLFHALIRNNMDIPYIKVDIKDKKELVESIALLNASSKNWALIDYVTSWSSIYDDYKKLINYYKIYDFELGDLSAILSNKTVCSTGSASIKSVKKGEFKISNEKENVNILDYLTEVLEILPRMNRFENKYLVREYVSFVRNTRKYNHTIFKKNLEINKKKFVLSTQENGKLSEMFKKLI